MEFLDILGVLLQNYQTDFDGSILSIGVAVGITIWLLYSSKREDDEKKKKKKKNGQDDNRKN